jgi:hypothetical protein
MGGLDEPCRSGLDGFRSFLVGAGCGKVRQLEILGWVGWN